MAARTISRMLDRKCTKWKSCEAPRRGTRMDKIEDAGTGPCKLFNGDAAARRHPLAHRPQALRRAAFRYAMPE